MSTIIKRHILKRLVAAQESEPNSVSDSCLHILCLNCFGVNFFEGIYSSSGVLLSASIRIIAFSGFSYFWRFLQIYLHLNSFYFNFCLLASLIINHSFGCILFWNGQENGIEICCESEVLLTQFSFISFDKWSVLLVPLSHGSDLDGCVYIYTKKKSQVCIPLNDGYNRSANFCTD